MLQSLQWLLRPPLRWTLELAARYGDTFRLRVLGPSSSGDHVRRAMIPRTLVIVSRPAHLREVFARSRDELQAGEAREFIRWHVGEGSVVVLDGVPHRTERQTLQSGLRSTSTTEFERWTREALLRAFAAWPGRGTIPLSRLVQHAVLDAILTCCFGPLDPARLQRLRDLVAAGALTTTVPPQVLVLPWLRRDLGPWSIGGRLKRAVAEFDDFVVQQMEARSGIRSEGITMLDALRDASTSVGNDSARRELVIQRVRTVLAGWLPTAIASVWLCYHVLRDPATRERARAAAGNGDDEEDGRYLEAACRESLRLHQPFLGAFRRVASPTTFGGIAWHEGTLVLPVLALTHRLPQLYPEPERFRPERFLEGSFGSDEYAPFGGGIRHCMGEQLALQQMGILLAELLKSFELTPSGQWSDAERRRYAMVVLKDPLRTTIQRRARAPLAGTGTRR